MTRMCPICLSPTTTPHGVTQCWQPLVMVRASADVVEQEDGKWVVFRNPQFLWCPECHYSEALEPKSDLQKATELFQKQKDQIGKVLDPESPEDWGKVIEDEWIDWT